MATLTEEDVFTFEELSDRAKDKARDWMRGLEAGDSCTVCLYTDFVLAAGILGIALNEGLNGKPDIMWSGFSCQGDGASFTGSYSHGPNSPAKIREEFPEETALHKIADGLDVLQNVHRLLTGHRINAMVTQSGNYVHKYTMNVAAEDSETGDDVSIEVESRILELMRDFAEWIYRSLEKEYDYRQSDEAIDEAIEANDYKFNEAGERV